MPSKRGKKACTECRQQKAKCDAFLNSGQPCSRCQKVKARCIISDPFKREHKRKRLSELEQETDELRRKLRTSETHSNTSSPMAILTAAAQMDNDMGSGENQSSSQVSLGYAQPAIVQPALFPPSIPPSLDSASGNRGTDRAIPRTLDGVKVTGDEIDDIFKLFFRDYANCLPILDPTTSPNTYYSKSPFLFWSIVRAASRSYSKNPTLLNAISRSVVEMALLSLISTSSPIYTIKGLLILLYWPFPRDNDAIDPTFPLSGMLLHLAMQNGLHIPMSSHEFSKVRIPAPSEADMAKRSEVWAQCVIVYQRTCLSKGQSPRSLSDLTHEPIQSHVLFQRISPSLALELRCQEIIVRCCNAVLENGVRALSPDQERALDIILRIFDSQVKELELQLSSESDRLHISICRLHTQSFYLFKTNPSDDCIAKLVATSCTVIERIGGLGSRPGLLAASPLYLFSAVGIAACSLLKILKSSAPRNLDTERAKSAFFLGINIMKQISAGGNESASKFVSIMNQLWNSSKAFRTSEGHEYPGLRIRSRLSMSVTLDVFWWWRDEFDTQHRPLLPPQESADTGNHNSHGSTEIAGQENAGVPPENQENFYLDDQFLSDFEWALGNDRLFLPTELCGPIWSSATNVL